MSRIKQGDVFVTNRNIQNVLITKGTLQLCENQEFLAIEARPWDNKNVSDGVRKDIFPKDEC